jgi:precorrin-6Y C5,15-methyltransferase (decarboxylating)
MKQIKIIGVGMGNPETLTIQAKKTIEQCTCLVGAARMLEGWPQERKIPAIRPEEICSAIQSAPEGCIGVLMSGDVGFYSGCNRLLPLLKDYEVECIAGISSLQYFCAKVQLPWQDAHVVSLHGREGDLLQTVRRHPKVFVLTGGGNGLAETLRELQQNGPEEAILWVGERLSYPDECITKGPLGQATIKESYPSLTVLLIQNPEAACPLAPGKKDEAFLRGKVPMTKEEVRTLSIAKLSPQAGDVIWDVGAGTGSVAVELALLSPSVQVYALERGEEGVALIQQNKSAFGVKNLHVIHGTAPDDLEKLPTPQRVFIGGSGGKLKEVFSHVLGRNPKARLVVNAITLETVQQALSAFAEHGMEPDITQVTIAKGKAAGPYHMMMGQNPVYILAGGGEQDEEL